jgi:hypothetical protein
LRFLQFPMYFIILHYFLTFYSNIFWIFEKENEFSAGWLIKSMFYERQYCRRSLWAALLHRALPLRHGPSTSSSPRLYGESPPTMSCPVGAPHNTDTWVVNLVQYGSPCSLGARWPRLDKPHHVVLCGSTLTDFAAGLGRIMGRTSLLAREGAVGRPIRWTVPMGQNRPNSRFNLFFFLSRILLFA